VGEDILSCTPHPFTRQETKSRTFLFISLHHDSDYNLINKTTILLHKYF
jgi:hypothetical protein